MNAPAADEVILIRQLERSFPMGDTVIRALRGVDITIRRGEYVAIMGPSGSGKSTLMNILGCLDTPTEGQYLFDNVDVSTLSDDELSAMRNREIGFIFQNFNLLPKMNSLQNVELPLMYAGIPKAMRRERAIEALERVGLADRMDHKPTELSGGQRQRVAVARALVTKPGILLADEPTGALDQATGKEIIDLLKELNVESGVTIISATHDLKMIDVSDRIVHIRDGGVERIERREDIDLTIGEM